MSRKRRERSLQAKENWPALLSSLNENFGERFWMEFSSFEEARAAAAEKLDQGQIKQVLQEWWSWNATVGAVDDPRTEIAHLGVEPRFDSSAEGRQFMNAYYDTMITKVRAKEPGWKP